VEEVPMADDAPALDQPIITITGEKVALGPPNRGHISLLDKWDNDLALSILSGDPARPRPREGAEAQYERYSRGEQREEVLFIIYERATLRPIGLTEFTHIDLAHRTATYGIVIGEPECWGKGYGTETTILMLDYAFQVLGLHNVMLDVHGFNQRAMRAYLRAGFKVFGRRREAYRIGSRVYDAVYMECLASEFQSPLTPVVDLLLPAPSRPVQPERAGTQPP
jgi:RimJ/RimL family protein N-acetyltransferase